MNTAEELLKENTHLVHFVMRRQFPSLAGDQDIAQEGLIGLWRASLKYDGREGVKFSTFAIPCIRNAILMELRKRRRLPNSVSFDAPLGGDDDDTFSLSDVLSDPAAAAFEANIFTDDFIQRLHPKDRQLVELRMAGLKQSTIGDAIGISQVMVSRRLRKIRALYHRTGGGGTAIAREGPKDYEKQTVGFKRPSFCPA